MRSTVLEPDGGYLPGGPRARTRLYPRRCVFFGTHHDSEFLRTGPANRRFWRSNVPAARRESVFDDIRASSIRSVRRPSCATGGRGAEPTVRREKTARRSRMSNGRASPGSIIRKYLDTPIPRTELRNLGNGAVLPGAFQRRVTGRRRWFRGRGVRDGDLVRVPSA